MFMPQVGRETEVDCALAELYVRGLATERLVKDQHQAEIFNSIYSRMNEVSAGCVRFRTHLLAVSLRSAVLHSLFAVQNRSGNDCVYLSFARSDSCQLLRWRTCWI